MNSFSLRDHSTETLVVLQPTTSGKRRLTCCVSIGVVLIVASFFFVVGYEYHKKSGVDGSIEAELAAGLGKLVEWYPEGAAEIRAHEQTIIQYMATMTEPPDDSPLRQLVLTPSARRLKNVSQKVRMQPLQKETDDEVEGDDGENTRMPSKAENCSEAVAIVLYDVVEFVTNFVLITVPEKKRFRVRLLRWLYKSYDERKLDGLADIIAKLALANSAQDKARIVFLIVFQGWLTGGGWLKVLFDWVMDESRNHWVGIKRCARLAAHLTLWFSKGITQFVSQASLLVMSVPKMITSARTAREMCSKPSQKEPRLIL